MSDANQGPSPSPSPTTKPDYILKDDGDYHCSVCASVIMAVNQRRPVWEFPSLCAGFGNVKTVQAPYCPNCEEPPPVNGPPIMG